jgi:hypothetical protein
MTSVGRNEPCPCGSGKKYKKCCLAKETSIDLDAFRADKAEESLRGEILKFATGERFTDEMLSAYQPYRGGAVDAATMMANQDPMENIRYLDWFIHEHKHSESNKTIIGMFDDLKSKGLDDDQKALLVEWRASRLGAFEVKSADDGVLELADVFGEETYSIKDESACEEVEAGMVVVARVTSSFGERKLAGAPVLVPAKSKQKLIDTMGEELEKNKKDNPDADLTGFASENTHLLISTALDLA